MENKNLHLGFLKAKNVTRRFAKTFYFASFFLPKDKKLASYAIYAICRISDESVDAPGCLDQKESLDKIKKRIDLAYSDESSQDSLLLCFRHTVHKYGVPKKYFDELISGMQMDIAQSRYRNFGELYSYCYRVAGVIGLIMLKILGSSDKKAGEFAISLGVAMQLTNILRDIKEDYLKGRIYIPLDEIKKFGVSEDDIALGNNTESFAGLVNFEIIRCRKYYADCQEGIKMIPGARSRFMVMAIKETYSALLDRIKNNPYDIFTKRVRVANYKKILIIIKIIIKGKYLCA